MCQYHFVDYNKCATVVGAVISRGGYVCVETGDRLEISIPSAQSCCELKTLLRNKVHYLKKLVDIYKSVKGNKILS